MERKIDRFDKYMKYKGLNDNQVTIQLSLSVGIIGKSRKENRDLSNSVIEKILNFYTDLNRNWLLTGDGEMLNHEAIIPPVQDRSEDGIDFTMENVRSLIRILERTLAEKDKQIDRLLSIIEQGKV